MPSVRRILYILMWLVLWGSGLVGIGALGFLIYLLIEHSIYCDPPALGWTAECLTTEDAAAFLIANGLPWLIPLVVALIFKGLIRTTGHR
jgi:hypothetical protein